MKTHNCHNREFPKTVWVQDGWKNVDIRNPNCPPEFTSTYIATRVPNMVEIPFTMSRNCHQWDKPFGAIIKGLIDPAGCLECKWAPSEEEI